MTQHQRTHRLRTALGRVVIAAVWTLLGAAVVVAQAQTARVLTPGTAVTGTLDSDNFLQVFTLVADAGQALTVTASNEIGIPLALVVTDAAGNPIAQIADSDVTGEVILNTTVETDGTYYITVFKAAGVSSVSELEFTLVAELTAAAEATAPIIPLPSTAVTADATAEATLSADGLLVDPAATADPLATADAAISQLITTTGMTIDLSWATTDDLDLEIRDPIGGSLYFQTPTVPSGGTIGPNLNQGCAVTSAAPVETATWSPGGIPTGSYEVLVYFQEACDDQNPVTFNIEPIVDGQSLSALQGTVLPGQVFVTSFVVRADGTAQFTGLSGVADEQALPDTAAALLTAATPITVGTSAVGTISTTQPYTAYSFTAGANDIVTISLNATSGSLDTLLLLLDAQGNIVRSNDDLADGITDSQITNALLPNEGTYTIIATRYALRIGGTEGDYSLTVSATATNLPEAFLLLPRGSLEFTLLWNTDDDLQLLVRDPAGDAVFDDQPTIRSGARLAAQGNINCTVSEGTPFSYIYYPQGTQPRPGVYEIEIQFQSECADTTQAVNFNLFATSNGQEVFNVSASPLLGERYLISFTLEADGSYTVSDGGIARGLETLPYQAELENAVVIGIGETINSSITQDNKFDIFVFEADAGDTFNVSMVATSGTLDPTLYLVSPFNNLVAENDDAVVGENLDSLIANLTLPESGRYIIIATHFGALYGGTTGTYSLTLTQLN